MLLSRRFRLALASFALAGSPGFAAEVRWDPLRSSSPDTVEELRALEKQVKVVTEKVMPCTVGLLVGQGAGSGVIVTDSGLVLTAAHVIGKPGETCEVVLSDGKRVAGISLGVNGKLDSGMVQITGKPPAGVKWPGVAAGKWPVAELGTSAGLKKNQWLISLGHHGGPRTGRTPPLRLGRFDNFNKSDQTLKTDCTLVGGDSGGPLFDLNGKLVGIHSKIGIFLEYNMHVPIDAFRPDWDQLAEGAVLGKPPVELGATLDSKKIAPTVIEVIGDSPAAKATLAEGDVIVKFGGNKVLTRTDLKAMLMECQPGQTVTLVVLREDENVTLKLTFPRRGAKKE